MWATADDGTEVPVSVVCRAGMPPRRPEPLLLYGYGSYEISIDPGFTAPAAVPARPRRRLRRRPRAGRRRARSTLVRAGPGRLHKRNTFTDFVAAGEFLVEAGWADPARIAAMGGSAGGLLMGAVANLAPELFCGILAQVPFVDPLTTVLDPCSR